MTKKRINRILTLVFLISVIASLPHYVTFNLSMDLYIGKFENMRRSRYQLITAAITLPLFWLLIPLIIICIAYTFCAKTLLARNILTTNQDLGERRNKNCKIVKRLLIITTLFFLLNAPLEGITLYQLTEMIIANEDRIRKFMKTTSVVVSDLSSVYNNKHTHKCSCICRHV